MHDFSYKGQDLYCEGVRVSSVAKKVDTPFYLYSHKTIVDHYQKIKKAFASIDPLICFAVKANGNLAVLKSLVNQGAGFDIVSANELRKALQVGADPQRIAFASVGKTEEEIRFALKTEILFFNVESEPELKTIEKIAARMKKIAPVALRINPDVDAATHEFITTGTLKKKFGIDLRSTKRILKARNHYPHIRIKGLHMHIGSQIVSSEPFVKAIKKMVDFIDELKDQGIPIEYLDIGGGLGIIYKNEKPQTAEQFARAVLPVLKKSGLQIVMEPGRFIAGNAGIFVTKALYLKDNGIKKFLIVDGGMNDLIRPSLYDAYHEILPVKKRTGKKVTVDVVGPICESGDFFGKDRRMTDPRPGDLLAVMSAGAYGFVMASNYNARCRPPEVLVKGRQSAVVKERETLSDLLAGETVPAFLE